jgi:multidrug resistance efflux pump
MKNIRAFLAQLSKELQRAEDVDIEAREILQDLHRDVEQLEESDRTQIQSVLDRVKALESKFAATHPVLERTARELADAIAKMNSIIPRTSGNTDIRDVRDIR